MGAAATSWTGRSPSASSSPSCTRGPLTTWSAFWAPGVQCLRCLMSQSIRQIAPNCTIAILYRIRPVHRHFAGADVQLDTQHDNDAVRVHTSSSQAAAPCKLPTGAGAMCSGGRRGVCPCAAEQETAPSMQHIASASQPAPLPDAVSSASRREACRGAASGDASPHRRRGRRGVRSGVAEHQVVGRVHRGARGRAGDPV